MHKPKLILVFIAALLLFQGCTNPDLLDVNVAVADNKWVYAKSIKHPFEIKDSTKSYQLFFKLRHTTEYRYANLYVLMRLKGNGLKKTLRYQFKVAQPNGEWIGKGSGDIYTNVFPLLKDYRFPKNGKYEIEIEQNMRDNPLVGISDIGILVREKQAEN